MRSSHERAGGTGDVLRLVIGHPMRTWVEGLETLLRPRHDIEIVLAHTKPGWVHNAVATEQVDVLLLHLAPPGHDLKATLADLFGRNERLGVVALADSTDPALGRTAISAGARGWVEPTSSLDHLVRVLHGVARGETWYPPGLLTSVVESLLEDRESRERTEAELSTLSARELEVLVRLAQGMSRTEIARQLAISPHTVRTHVNNVLHKLEVHSVLAAVAVARRAGLLHDHTRRA